MDVWMKKHRMTCWFARFVVLIVILTSPSIARAVAECTPTQISSFQSKCDAYGAYVAGLESSCVAMFGSHYLCGYYPLPSQVRPIPDGYGCAVTWIRSPSGLEGPIPSSTGNVYTLNCSDLTITLSGGSEVEPSNGSTINTLPFIATVIDQNTGQPTTNPINVHISLKVDPTSGGHDHGDSTRPRGGIADVQTCTSDAECWSNPTANGAVVFNFNPTDASGTHTITATCDGCSNTATANVDVKVDGLKPIPPSGLYALYEVDGSVIGAVAGEHPSNHYLTSGAANKLLVIAINYHHLYPKDPVIYVNDASLMWGGVFDLDADWDTPHEEHRRGSVVDIRANSKAGAIPAVNFDALIRLAKLSKVNAKIHNPGETNQHFHVRLLNRSE